MVGESTERPKEVAILPINGSLQQANHHNPPHPTSARTARDGVGDGLESQLGFVILFSVRIVMIKVL